MKLLPNTCQEKQRSGLSIPVVFFSLITFSLIAFSTVSQTLGINSTGNPPDNSAGLDVDFTDRGVLIPRLSSTQRDAISNPAVGLQIYNTTTNCLNIYKGNAWYETCGNCIPGIPSQPGSITGNSIQPVTTSGLVYSISTVPLATSYTWTIPSGWSITSGQGTTSITVTSGGVGDNGTVTVSADNDCGASTLSTMDVIIHYIHNCGMSLVDNRDNKVYGTVQIGTQCWMTENLAYDGGATGCSSVTWDNNNDVGWCGYHRDDTNQEYGILYQWSAAMDGGASSNSVPSGVQGICPSDWHLPSDDEWKVMEAYLGVPSAELDQTGYRGIAQGVDTELKQQIGAGAYWGGTNSTGFSALPTAMRYSSSWFSMYMSSGIGSGFWWTSTETSSTFANRRQLRYSSSSQYTPTGIDRGIGIKQYAMSIRCIKD